MKIPSGHSPLKYQTTEYDCVPTTFLNSLSFLFKRNEIPPEVIQRILLYSLDTINRNGENGKIGTTGLACEFISHWLNQYSNHKKSFNLDCEYIIGEEVHLKPNNKIVRCINDGGVALISVSYDKIGSINHYMLGTKADSDYLYFFDPYFRKKQFKKTDSDYLHIIKDEWSYNLKVSRIRLDLTVYDKYSLGPKNYRECCLIKRI